MRRTRTGEQPVLALLSTVIRSNLLSDASTATVRTCSITPPPNTLQAFICTEIVA